MFTSYIKIALRNLRRNRTFSLINIAGLAIGMAVSFLLILYVLFQFSFDSFHKNNRSVFAVKTGGEGGPNLPIPLAPYLKRTIPEIRYAVRTSYPAPHLLQAGEKSVKLNGMYTDPQFQQLFTFPVIKGSEQALGDVNVIVLTESTARTLFGKTDVVGQMVKLDTKQSLMVAAVVKDPPGNSTITFSYLLSWRLFEKNELWVQENSWGNFGVNTYVQLEQAANAAAVERKIRDVLHEQQASIPASTYLMLHPMSEWKLYDKIKDGKVTGGKIDTVRLFGLLGLGILLIACVNFMNLSTAQSEQRAREVGVRKAIGANRTMLIGQFMGESLLLVGVSLLLALILMWALLPWFNTLTGSSLTLLQAPVAFWIAVVGLGLLTGIISGSYPAFFLSSFRPVAVLKGSIIQVGSTFRPRQALVVFQFTLAVALMIVTVVIYRQIRFIQQQPVGYNVKGLVDVQLEGKVYDEYSAFREEAIASGAVTNGTIVMNSISTPSGSVWGLSWPGQREGEKEINFGILTGTEHFASTFGLTVKEGRDFLSPADSFSIMINEAALKVMRLKEPVTGQQIVLNGQTRTITGVVKNFVWEMSYMPAGPMVFPYNPSWRGVITFRMNPDLSVSECMARLEKVYHSFNADYPFGYSFVDESYQQKYAYEKLLGSLVKIFATLAIVISCLGLLGLSVFATARRKKEVGIRKVMGAGVTQVTVLLSGEFLKPVFIAIIVATPVACYIMHRWLQHYTYRISIEWWMCAGVALLAILIALLTVSVQSVRAALMNPVKALRTE
ncbi:ABC transporter permease [Chitinophaga tropicalis]|uniref:FtsX-like permease family protein n=1 Tax=Chitinophaga tropicalis TaxID=2683588 RepID=A0A7K1TZ10_9BACT|nr:ABC transporter permease [Chitinophaga tropicalis]MVT07333.1 FtsX-like permease family protein [Chitinophaga tropicalis]